VRACEFFGSWSSWSRRRRLLLSGNPLIIPPRPFSCTKQPIPFVQTHFVRRSTVVSGLGGSALVVGGSGRHDRRGR
jgi:hypothetical protein